MEWILQQQEVSSCLHYLNDFLTVGPPQSSLCQQNLDTIQQVCEWLGIPLALDKVAGPSTSLDFLGWILFGWKHVSLWTNCGGLGNKLVAGCKRRKPPSAKSFHSWESYSMLQRLLGVAGPSLAECMLQLLSCEKFTFTLDCTRSSGQTCAGGTFFWKVGMVSACSSAQPLLSLQPMNSQSNRCIGFLGLWSLFEGRWLQLEWSKQWFTEHIMAKELLSIVLSCAVWGPTWARHKILFQCDNSSVVAALQKGSAKDNTVMHLLRCLSFFVAHYNIALMSEHIAGLDNCTADHLSRNNMYNFFFINL